MGKQAPAAPDYTAAAQKQSQDSADATNAQTGANRPNQSNPFGSSQWTQSPTGQWSQNSSFAGPMGDAAGSLQQQYADMLRQPMQDGSAARDQAINAAYGQATSRLDPQWDKRQSAQQTQLLNQGLDPTSEASHNAMTDFGQQRNDAYSSAMNSAIGMGNQAGNDVFRNNLAARMSPLQQMGAMQGLLGQQGFNAAGRADPAQLLAAAMGTGNYNMQKWNAEKQANADAFGGGMQALGGGLSLFGF